MRLHFLGADRQVTGSKYLLEAAGLKILVDCGLFQERPYLDRNWEKFPVPPEEIDVLLLTHAHLDHSGFIPRLVKLGYSNRIKATAPTAALAKIVLLDTAHIQEEDVNLKRKRHAKEGRSGPNPEIPLYTSDEARVSFPLFENVAYLQPLPLNGQVTVRFHDAGHILGSSMLDIDVQEGGGQRRIIFSGDIGQWHKPLVHDPSVFESADFVIMESTYGDKVREAPEEIENRLARCVNETVARGGNIVIPVFAVERAQRLMFYIARLVRARKIPRLLVFLDSPMAVEATRVYMQYPEYMDEETAGLLRSNNHPFEFPGLKLFTTPEESKGINTIKGSCIIMAGSGMCTGGRIKHHLMHNIERPECTILFVGYQARHTLGRQIVEGDQEVRINGQRFQVKARIEKIEGISGHADKDDLLRWLGAFKKPPRRLFLTHGEEEVSLELAAFLEREKKWAVTVPRYKETVEL